MDFSTAFTPLVGAIATLLAVFFTSAGVTKNARLRRELAELLNVAEEVQRDTVSSRGIQRSIDVAAAELTARKLVPVPVAHVFVLSLPPFIVAYLAELVWKSAWLYEAFPTDYIYWPSVSLVLSLLALFPVIRFGWTVHELRERQRKAILAGRPSGLNVLRAAETRPRKLIDRDWLVVQRVGAVSSPKVKRRFLR